MKPAVKNGLKAAVGLALLALLLSAVEPRELLETLRNAAPLPLAGSFAAYLVMNLFEGWRTQIVFERYRLTFGTAFRITLVGTFLGNFTPGMVGADLYKVYFLNRRERGFARPIALLLLLRVLGMIFVFAFAGLGLLAGHGWRTEPLAGSALALGLGDRVRGIVQELKDALRQVRAPQLGSLVLLSAGVAFTRALSLWWLVLAFTDGLLFWDMAVVVAFSVVANAVPITIGGLGLQEGAVAAGLVLYGAARPDAVAVSLLNRVFTWLLSIPGAIAFARSREEKKEDTDQHGPAKTTTD
ncbi:MAG TPA: lysylphosphatidylglycerol synthase transmembrane domain-containing protein [Thermoanaerobaculia bacterium]|nr:lysylphosphatidylglycerol synthase transmembrane domain-containing protein [Thermoanaerobaculia bacterium]